jgi:hypothetical protein
MEAQIRARLARTSTCAEIDYQPSPFDQSSKACGTWRPEISLMAAGRSVDLDCPVETRPEEGQITKGHP